MALIIDFIAIIWFYGKWELLENLLQKKQSSCLSLHQLSALFISCWYFALQYSLCTLLREMCIGSQNEMDIHLLPCHPYPLLWHIRAHKEVEKTHYLVMQEHHRPERCTGTRKQRWPGSRGSVCRTHLQSVYSIPKTTRKL